MSGAGEIRKSRKSALRLGVKTTDGTLIHCGAAYGDYHTLCGMDADDPTIGHLGAFVVGDTTKIDCPACANIFMAARQYKIRDFKAEALK